MSTAIAIVGAQILLVVVLAAAALTKCADKQSAQESLGELGVPVRFRDVVAAGMPVVELGLAGWLLVAASGRWPAVAVLVLLTLYTTLLLAHLLRGRRPRCHCFGRFSSARIGWWTVVRNVALMAAAGVLVWQRPRPLLAGETWAQVLQFDVSWPVWGLSVAVLTEAVWLLGLTRQNGRLLLRLESVEKSSATGHKGVGGLPVGVPAPDFELEQVAGPSVSLASLRLRGLPVVLLFWDAHCGPCQELLPHVTRWQHEDSGRVTVVLVTTRVGVENRRVRDDHNLRWLLLDRASTVSHAYGVVGSPTAVCVDSHGRVATPAVAGTQGVVEMTQRVVSQPGAVAAAAGAPARSAEGVRP